MEPITHWLDDYVHSNLLFTENKQHRSTLLHDAPFTHSLICFEHTFVELYHFTSILP